MNTSKKIGRLVMLKYYLIFIIIIFSIPVVLELVEQLRRSSVNLLEAVQSTYKLSTLDAGEIFFTLVQLLLLAACIWFFGGAIGKAIIDDKKSKFWFSLKAISLLWLVILISVLLFTVASLHNEYPQHLVINNMVTVTYIYAALCAIHGFIFAYFMGKEIERRGVKLHDYGLELSE